MSIVRNNLMTRSGYTPYCGNMGGSCHMPRSVFTGEQFKCPNCGWESAFEQEFISQYKLQWGKEDESRV